MTHTNTGTETQTPAASKHNSTAESFLDFVALGCLVAGTVGVMKAMELDSAGDAFLCLGCCLAACGLVCYLFFQRD